VTREEVVPAEGHEGVLLRATPPFQHLLDGTGEVIVGDAVRDAAPPREGRLVAGEETLLPRRRERAHERLERVGQADAEERRLLVHPGDAHQGVAPVALRLCPRRVRQRQEAPRRALLLLLPALHVLPDGALLARVAVLRDQAVVDALGCVPLLARRRPVRLQPRVDRGRDRVQQRPRPWRPLAVAPRWGTRPADRFPHHAPMVALLLRNRPDTLMLDVVRPSDHLDVVHC